MPNERLIPANANASVLTFTLKVNGEDIPSAVSIKQIVVTKELNKIATAKIIILDGDPALEDFPISSGDFFVPGNDLEIYAGYQSEEDLIFKGILIKHGIQIRSNGTSVLKIVCKDPAVKMTISRKNRVFKEKKDSEVIDEIVGEYGLQSEIANTTFTHEDLVQYYCSDWDFIMNRIDVNGQIGLINEGVFKTFELDVAQEPVLELFYGANILAFDAEIDARNQYTEIKSTSWNYADQSLIEIEAEDPGVEEVGNLSATDIAEVLDQSLLLQHSGQIEEDELQVWANAGFLKTKLSKVRGRVRITGFAKILPGDVVSINGMGDRFNGKAIVSGIMHQLSEGEWITDIQIGIDPEWYIQKHQIQASENSGLLPAISGLQIGVVVQLGEDPNGEYRVLVDVPILATEEEGVWARMLLPDAGENRGLFFRPEIGDEVVVGFINNDPTNSVIVGGVHSTAQNAPVEPTDDNFQKGFFSKEELKLMFDDEIKAIHLETPNGNKILLSEDEGGITLEDENSNKIIMSGDGITIESAKDLILTTSTGDVKIEGVNVEISAQAQFKAEGSAGAEVSTSAIAVLKGSLVQIN